MKTKELKTSIPTDFQLQQLINEVVSSYRPVAYARNINLQVIDDFAAPVTLAGSRTGLFRILDQLLNNIFKIAEGKVVLSTRQLVQTEKELLLEFTINTDGQLSNTYINWTDQFDEVKAFIEIAGGKSELYSGATVGSTFKFIIKFGWKNVVQKPSLPEFSSLNMETLAGKKILIAEDNEINQKVITHLLRRENIEVHLANDGKEAVELFEANGVYDLVIMDLHMPRMNGFQAANYIRKILQSSVPIIAMTASAYPNEQIHCFEVGMNQYISKPFSAEELFKHLRYFLLADHQFTSSGSTAMPSTTRIYNLDYLEGANDPQYLCEVLELFIDKTPGLLGEIKSNIREGNQAAAIEKTAKLKGSLSILNMKEILQLVHEMDVQIRKGSEQLVLLDLVSRLTIRCNDIYPVLSEDLVKMKMIRV